MVSTQLSLTRNKLTTATAYNLTSGNQPKRALLAMLRSAMQMPLSDEVQGMEVSGEAPGAPAHTRPTQGEKYKILVQYRQSAAAPVIVRTLVRGALTADFVELSKFKLGFKSKTYVRKALAVGQILRRKYMCR